MALDKIVVSALLYHADSGITYQRPRKGVTQTNSCQASGHMFCSTSAGTINLGNVTSPGMSWFVNLDETDSIQIGINVSATFYPFANLRPGIPMLLDLDAALKSATVLQCKASANTPILLYVINDL